MSTPTITSTSNTTTPHTPAPKSSVKTGLLDPKMLWRSIPDALRKLDPRTLWHNPVMFIVEIGAVWSTVLAASGTLLPLRHSGWQWAEGLALTRDVGFSAGALACIAVATAAMRSPWRLRVRAGLVLYVTVSFLFAGTLADLEHLWAAAVGLPA